MIRRYSAPLLNLVVPVACVFAFPALATIVIAAEVSVTRLDGTAITGNLREWNTDSLLLATPTGDQQIPSNQLASLRWHPANSPPAADKLDGSVELIDGTILPTKSIHVDHSNATITLAVAEASEGRPLTLPIAQISVIRLRQLEGPLAAQWDEMQHQNVANDVIAVLKKDGKSLDYAEGVMGDIADDKIEFKLDGETQRVDRSKIAGAIYYRPDRRLKEEPRASIQGRSGLRVSAAHIELKNSRLEMTTATGLKLFWPLGDISLADFSAGKLIYLSDIEPASSKWTPFVGLPPSATLAAKYGEPRRDKSAFGGPLSLLTKEGESAAAQAATRSFSKGLALRSRTEIVYRLPAGFRRFIAIAGIDPTTSAAGNTRLAIFGDDRVLFETDITGNEPPRPIQLDIANVKRLKILVDYGQNTDTGDWLNLCDARIAK
jgi:NPCBM/NEW2 domain-containing protein